MKCGNSEIYFSDAAIQSLVATIGQAVSEQTKIFVLADENTYRHCWPLVQDHFVDIEINLMVIEPGEDSKSIEVAHHLWNEMLDQNADRKSILINLGGGVVTDLGGFVASTFKRGIRFINMPTSLMAMADASIGGKTGIDLGVSKNQVGTFASPSEVLILPSFLESLQEQEKLSGLAECVKHGLLDSPELLDEILEVGTSIRGLEILQQVISVKVNTVQIDPMETGLRKSLNLGHTVGHAVESSCLAAQKPIPHGFAVMMGLLAELRISEKAVGLDPQVTAKIQSLMDSLFADCRTWKTEIVDLETYMEADKKNVGGQLRFSLLKNYGDCEVDCTITQKQLANGLKHLSSWLSK